MEVKNTFFNLGGGGVPNWPPVQVLSSTLGNVINIRFFIRSPKIAIFFSSDRR